MRQLTDTKTAQLPLSVQAIAGMIGTPASLPLSLIDAEDQVRTTSGIDDSLDELADDIKQRGVIAPVIVRQVGDRFVLVAGHRRTLASHLAGLESIPAIITEANADQVLELQLAENIHRENLDLAELAAAVRRLFDKHGDLAKIGEIVKKSKPWVSKHLALSYPEFSNTAKHLLMSGATSDLELLHAVNQIDKTNCMYYELHDLVDKIKAGTAGRKEARDLLVMAKARRDANKVAMKSATRSSPTSMPPAVDLVGPLINAARAIRDGDEREVNEILAAFDAAALQAIDDALPSSSHIADSHAKGAEFKDKPAAVQMRVLSVAGYYDRAAFIVGLLGLQLNARNYLIEAREIARIDLND